MQIEIGWPRKAWHGDRHWHVVVREEAGRLIRSAQALRQSLLTGSSIDSKGVNVAGAREEQEAGRWAM